MPKCPAEMEAVQESLIDGSSRHERVARLADARESTGGSRELIAINEQNVAQLEKYETLKRLG